ncbi:hypothetical protein F5887DRAFT_914534 [Amanita rubescens]|nr:hypothetical protein F5887DRAFT_914534 [Amanita rubescens]
MTDSETINMPVNASNAEHVRFLKDHYKCPHFRILVIGRANAGKTTILEKVCGVAQGTKPIIYDQKGGILHKPNKLVAKFQHRGIHEIEHQITYPGSNFIFHDSQGFEAGANEEMETVWNFIEKRSAAPKLKDQLHAIWYCIPMEGSRPLLSAELEFFTKGTGNVPLITIFTKFDAQIIQEYVKLNDVEERWHVARANADNTFKEVYLSKVLKANYPPKAYVKLEDMHIAEKNCTELTEQTANAIDDTSLQAVFISTQRNNLHLCVKAALHRFPHYWVTDLKRINALVSIEIFLLLNLMLWIGMGKYYCLDFDEL